MLSQRQFERERSSRVRSVAGRPHKVVRVRSSTDSRAPRKTPTPVFIPGGQVCKPSLGGSTARSRVRLEPLSPRGWLDGHSLLTNPERRGAAPPGGRLWGSRPPLQGLRGLVSALLRPRGDPGIASHSKERRVLTSRRGHSRRRRRQGGCWRGRGGRSLPVREPTFWLPHPQSPGAPPAGRRAGSPGSSVVPKWVRKLGFSPQGSGTYLSWVGKPPWTEIQFLKGPGAGRGSCFCALVRPGGAGAG